MMYAVPVCIVMIFTAIVLHFVIAGRMDKARYAPRHTRAPGPRHAFADPADVTGPDGELFVVELHHEDPPPAVRRWTPPPAGTYERVLGALRSLRAGEPGQPVTETQPIPHAVGTWGMTAPELLSDLSSRYLT